MRSGPGRGDWTPPSPGSGYHQVMVCNPNAGSGRYCYALVTYIPDPLGKFLDDFRRELVPNFIPHAHVTILPPRLLDVEAERAWKELKPAIEQFEPFRAELGEVEIFSRSSVIYIGVTKGFEKFLEMHERLSLGCMNFNEPFEYHPHITLAQQLTPEQVEGVFETARIRWAEYPHDRAFEVNDIAFVRNIAGNEWLDLGTVRLDGTSGPDTDAAVGDTAPVLLG
jgi:2'-5' RNA ligase